MRKSMRKSMRTGRSSECASRFFGAHRTRNAPRFELGVQGSVLDESGLAPAVLQEGSRTFGSVGFFFIAFIDSKLLAILLLCKQRLYHG